MAVLAPGVLGREGGGVNVTHVPRPILVEEFARRLPSPARKPVLVMTPGELLIEMHERAAAKRERARKHRKVMKRRGGR